MSLKTIEQGILKGDWAKVVKGFNSISGQKLKAPTKTTKSTTVAKPKTITKVKTVQKIVYKSDPSVVEVINFYADKANYGVSGSGIAVLMDGGEKARKANIQAVEEDDEIQSVDNDDEDIQEAKPKKTKQAKTNSKLTLVNGLGKVKSKIFEARKEDDEADKNKKYLKKLKKKNKDYREPDDSKTVIEHKCSICNTMKTFRKFETENYFGGKKMDAVCNECHRGG